MRGTLLQRLRTRARILRRRTVLGPLLDAYALRAIVTSIDADVSEVRVLGPDEFAPYLRCLTPLGNPAGQISLRPFAWVIVPQDRLPSLPEVMLCELRDGYRCVKANRRYLLFCAGALTARVSPPPDVAARARLDTLVAPADTPAPVSTATAVWADRAILVTTFERPAALARSLPQLARLGQPILLVDDGSRGSAAEHNRALARAHGVEYLALPSNRGISAALSLGLEYLLADDRVIWISYFQDDVDVVPDATTRLHAVEDAEARPIVTGYDAEEHPVLSHATVAGVPVRLKRETAGVHLHAHRDYWRGVLPVPTQYLGAPKRRWDASLEDNWITVGAPASAGQRGIPVVCVPGLVRTFLWHAGDSTWGNPSMPDPTQPSTPVTRT